MNQGIQLFEKQARDEVAFKEFKKDESNILSNLIMSSENLSVKLD